MSTKISGKRLFSRFSWACAEERREKKLIKQEDFDELKSLMENNAEPDTILLALCFPNPVRGLRAFAKNTGRKMWSYETVLQFLKQHQGSDSNCAFKYGTVCDVAGEVVQVFDGRKTFIALNFHKLHLDVGVGVYAHRCVIIAEKTD